MDFSRRRGLAQIAIGSVWLLGIAAAVRVVDLILDHNPLASAIAGAVLVDFAASRAGVKWDNLPSDSDRSSLGKVARRLGSGVAIGTSIVAGTAAVGLVLGLARVSMGIPSPVLGFALIQAAAISVRDEFLYRGLVLTLAERAQVPGRVAVAYAALAGAAAIALLPQSSPGAWILTLASGWLFASLWRRGQSAWDAVGAHAAWGFCSGVLLRGGLLDVTWADGSLSPGARAEGTPAYLASAICVAMVLGAGRVRGVMARLRSPGPERR